MSSPLPIVSTRRRALGVGLGFSAGIAAASILIGTPLVFGGTIVVFAIVLLPLAGAVAGAWHRIAAPLPELSARTLGLAVVVALALAIVGPGMVRGGLMRMFAASALPLPEAAEVTSREYIGTSWMNGPGIGIEFRSTLTEEEMVQFYTTRLQQRGWTPGLDFDFRGEHHHSYHRRRERLILSIIPADGLDRRARLRYTRWSS